MTCSGVCFELERDGLDTNLKTLRSLISRIEVFHSAEMDFDDKFERSSVRDRDGNKKSKMKPLNLMKTELKNG
jgi:hypothetical protein